MSLKTCTKCKAAKPMQEFGRFRAGHRSYCKKCDRLRAKAYYEDNKESVRAKRRVNRKSYYANNRESIIKRQKQWQKNNMHIVLSNSAKRRAASKNAMIAGADKAYIQNLYANCREAEKLMKEVGVTVKFHVDHIIPLIHKDVCGLHNELNMQILNSEDNITKSNKFCIESYNSIWQDQGAVFLQPKDLLTTEETRNG